MPVFDRHANATREWLSVPFIGRRRDLVGLRHGRDRGGVRSPDARGEHRGIRYLQNPVVRTNGDVGKSNAQDLGVEHADGTRAHTNVVTHDEGPRHQEDNGGENVAEALLRGDAEDDASESRADEELLERHAQHPEEGEEKDQVAHARRDQAKGGARADVGVSRGQSAEGGGEVFYGVATGNQDDDGRAPGDHFGVDRRVGDTTKALADADGPGGNHARDDPEQPLALQ